MLRALLVASLTFVHSLRTPSRIAVYTSDVCVGHDPGSRAGQVLPEQPERLANLLRGVRGEWATEFGELMQVREPAADVTAEQLQRVHTAEHVERVTAAFEQARPRPGSTLSFRVNLDRDTVIQEPGSEAAARRAAGLVVAAVDDVLSAGADGVRRAFCAVRPPGHHASSSASEGFCIFNNVMVGVAHAQAVHNLTRVAVLDFDVHRERAPPPLRPAAPPPLRPSAAADTTAAAAAATTACTPAWPRFASMRTLRQSLARRVRADGNGGADISFCDPTRMYASSFEAGIYAGMDVVRGCDGLHGQIVSCPLPTGCGSEAFRSAWEEELLPAVRAFEPEALFLSAGFDAHAADPLASLQLREDDFAWLTREAAALCGGGLPIISVLEGGYDIDALEASARAHVRALIHGGGE